MRVSHKQIKIESREKTKKIKIKQNEKKKVKRRKTKQNRKHKQRNDFKFLISSLTSFHFSNSTKKI